MDVLDWARRSEIGDSLVYATRPDLAEQKTFSEAISFTTALKAHYEGLVFLCQSRRDDGFDYIAVRISRPTAFILKLLETPRT